MFGSWKLDLGIFRGLDGRSDVRAAGRGLLDFPGLQTTHANIDAAHGSVQKEDFYFLDVREKTATRDSGDLFTDTAGFFRETATHDRIAR